MAHPQHNFTSNFNGSEGHNAELTLNINGTEHKYTPAGNDKEFTVTGAVRINVNLDGSELAERITTVLNGDSLPLLVQQNLDGTEDSYTYVGLQDNEWLFGRVTTTHIDSVGIDTTDGSVRRETLPLASDVAIVSNTDPAVYTKLRTAVALGHLPVLDYQGTYATYVTIDNNILKFATEAADPNVESYVYTVASDNTVTATPRNAGVVRADSEDTEPGTLIDKLEVVDNVYNPDDPTDSPILSLETTVDGQGKRKVAINEDKLHDFAVNILASVDDIIDTLNSMDFDEVPHAYLASTLHQSTGDPAETGTPINVFSCDSPIVGDCFEFEQTTVVDNVPFGYIWVEPGTYIINASVTLQWVGVPRGTFVSKVGLVMGENFDFSQEQELVRSTTRIATIPTRTKLMVNITYDAGTPVMGFWIKSMQVVKLAGGMSQTNVTHDSTLTGQGSVADPLGVTPAVFGKVKDIPTSISQFRTGDVIPVDGPNGPAKIGKDDLIQIVLADNVAQAFDPTRQESSAYPAGSSVMYGGKRYFFKSPHYGVWTGTDVVEFPVSVTDGDVKYLKSYVNKIAAVVTGNNLFDLSEKVCNCFVSATTGELVSNNGMSTSGYIQVYDEQIYTCYVLKSTYGRIDCVACYNSNKTFIGTASINAVLADGDRAIVNFYPIKHTQFIRYSVSNSTSNQYNMFVVGDSYPSYYKSFNDSLFLKLGLLAREITFENDADEDNIVNGIQNYIPGDNLLNLSSVTAHTFVDVTNGTLTEYSGNCSTTDYMPVREGQLYSCISLKSLYGHNNTTACYDSNKNFIGIAAPNEFIDSEPETKINFYPLSGTKYVRITINTGALSNINKMFVVGSEYPTQYKDPASHKTATKIFVPKENIVGLEGQYYNYLYGKTWYACGDSFTHGDFTNMVDDDENPVSSTDPVIYDSEMSMYKTYPWQIANKNGMHLHNLAVNGGTIKGFYNNIMTTIPTDGVDFVTIAYGINDSAGIALGAINDTYANDTFYGYLNSVIQYFYDNMPFVHLAFIVMPDGMNNDYRIAQEEVCAKYGVPCFNLYKDPRAPMFMYKDGASSGGYNYSRYQKMMVKTASGTRNGHPSVYAHEFFSTCIEGFLRSI